MIERYKITFEFPEGISFSVTEEQEEEWLSEGNWKYPFPNEYGNSMAFGLMELYGQSDRFSGFFYRENPIRCTVKRLMEEPT